MTLTELENSLPNGLHDAQVSRLHFDYKGRLATLDLAICTGDPGAKTAEERGEYKNAQLIISGLQFAVIEPPDPKYSFLKAAALTIDACDSEDRVDGNLLSTLPAGAFARSFFVNEWNAFIHLAGMDASIEWNNGSKELKAKS